MVLPCWEEFCSKICLEFKRNCREKMSAREGFVLSVLEKVFLAFLLKIFQIF